MVDRGGLMADDMFPTQCGDGRRRLECVNVGRIIRAFNRSCRRVRPVTYSDQVACSYQCPELLLGEAGSEPLAPGRDIAGPKCVRGVAVCHIYGMPQPEL